MSLPSCSSAVDSWLVEKSIASRKVTKGRRRL
jgi:hypothetical protein